MTKRSTRLLPAGILILALLIAGGLFLLLSGSGTDEQSTSTITGDETRPLRFNPGNGRELAYRFDLTSESWVDFSFLGQRAQAPAATNNQAMKNQVKVSFSGLLHLKYYHDGQDGYDVAAVMDSVSHRINDTTPSYTPNLAGPFSFHQSNQGYMDGFEFDPAIPREAALVLENLIRSLQTAFPEQAKAEWRTRERDAVGMYRARYWIADDSTDSALTIFKEKLAYRTKEKTDDPAIQTTVDLGPNHTRLTISDADGCLMQLKQSETVRTLAASQVLSESEGRLSASLMKPTSHAALFPDTFQQFQMQTSAKPKVHPREKPVPDTGEVDLAGLTRAEVQNFRQTYDSDTPNARALAEARMLRFLADNPAACGDLVAVLNDYGPNAAGHVEKTGLVAIAGRSRPYRSPTGHAGCGPEPEQPGRDPSAGRLLSTSVETTGALPERWIVAALSRTGRLR